MINPRFSSAARNAVILDANDGSGRIIYIDKGPMLAAVMAGNYGPVGPYAPHVPEQPSLAGLKLAKQAEIRDLADGFLQALAVEYGAMEKLTWDQQAAEADALAADPSAQAPLARSIAAARGMNPLELATRIQANRAQWVVLSGYIVGQRLRYQDQLDAATTTEQVAAIVPVYTLP